VEQAEDRWCEAGTPAEARWSIRTKLQVEGQISDVALFNVAIDSKLRARPGQLESRRRDAKRPCSPTEQAFAKKKLDGRSSLNLQRSHATPSMTISGQPARSPETVCSPVVEALGAA
jgi:hypothetical protein